MKAGNLVTGLAVSLFLITSASIADTNKDTAGTDAKKAAAGNKVSSSSAGGFSYRPPMRGAPAARIGGGTRGIGDQTLEMMVLAPDHTGLTLKEQPTLYWYSSEPVSAKLEVTLINDDDIDPELEEIVTGPATAGIHSFDLAKTSAKLEPGKEYRWFVSAVADLGQRSNDIVASGTIQRIEPSNELKSRITGADQQSLASIYAEEGVWYDTIDALSRSIAKTPGNTELQAQRAALLEQVGLQAAADYARTHNQ